MFTQMSPTQRAKFLGLRRKGKTRAQSLAENAEFLRKTARVSLEELEAGALRAYARAEEASAALRATTQQTDFVSWVYALPAVKNQGGECGQNVSMPELSAGPHIYIVTS
jgi:hypothetical protein